MSAVVFPERSYRPPAPLPLTKPLGAIGLMRGLRNNPAATWGIWNFEKLINASDSIMGHTTVVSAPVGIRHIMVENVANYVRGDLQRRVLKPGLGEGLLTAEGDVWKRARRTLSPIFAPRAVQVYTQAMRDRTQVMVERLMRQAPAGAPGVRANITDEMTRLAFEILTDTLISDVVKTDQARFAEAFSTYFENLGRISPLDILKAPDWIPRIGKILAQPAIRFFEGEVKKIVGTRRALIASGKPAPHDLLTLLLEAADPETGQGLTEAEVGANIVTFMGAGHETTANALQWTLFLLSKHPAILAQVEAEADGADEFPLNDWVERLPMTRAVIEEAMRLYPPAAMLTRQALGDDEVLGVHIPKGSAIIIAPYIVHRHRMLWSDPELFRPERFMPGEREKIDRYAYIPFGAGPRICIAPRFAMYEAVIVLTTLLRSLRFLMAPGEGVTPVQRITLRPSPKLEMLVTRRH